MKKSGASYSETCAEGFLTGANLLKGFDEKERVIEGAVQQLRFEMATLRSWRFFFFRKAGDE